MKYDFNILDNIRGNTICNRSPLATTPIIPRIGNILGKSHKIFKR